MRVCRVWRVGIAYIRILDTHQKQKTVESGGHLEPTSYIMHNASSVGSAVYNVTYICKTVVPRARRTLD